VLARLIVLGGLLALVAFAAGPAEAESRLHCPSPTECVLVPSELRLDPSGKLVPWSRDVTIAKARPDFNHDRQTYLNVTGPADGAKAEMILLAFDRADFPPNVTIEWATLNLYFDCMYYGGCGGIGTADPQRASARDRILTAREIILPWEEENVTWNKLAGSYFLNTTLAAGLSGPRTCSNGDTDAGSPIGNGGPSGARCFDVAFSAREWLAGNGSRFGWAILDEGVSCPTMSDCRNVFFSSAKRNPDGTPYTQFRGNCPPPVYLERRWTQEGQGTASREVSAPIEGLCWPALAMKLNRHVPSLANATIKYNGSKMELFGEGRRSGPPTAFISNRVSVNLSVEARDGVGAIQEVRLLIRNETGVLFISETLKNRRLFSAASVAGGAKGERWEYWREGPLALPAGKYRLSITTLDTDLNEAALEPRGGQVAPLHYNLVVINDKPILSDLKVAGKPPFAQNARINFTASLRLNDSRQVLDAVLAYANSTAGHRLVIPLRLLARESGTSGGAGTWWFERAWTLPGNWTLTLFANDTFGNADRRSIRFNVTDVTAPVAGALKVEGAVFKLDRFASESGARLAFAATVTDDTNLTVDLVLKGAASTRRVPMARGLENRWAASLSDLPADTYATTVEARDVDGNLATSPTTLVEVEARKPPSFHDLAPPPGGWANATPTISLRIHDLTLNRSTIRTYTKVKTTEVEGVFEESLPSFGGSASDTIATLASLRFFRGDLVTVRVVANDTLGAHAEREWSFVIDGRAPTVAIAIGDPQRDVGASVAVTNGTTFSLSASDEESGVRSIAWQLESLDQAGSASPWIRYAGPFDVASSPFARGTGLYAVRYRATDVAGNTGGGGEIRVILDATPPAITHRVENGRLLVAVSDRGSGLAALRVLVSSDPSGTFWEEQHTPILDPSGQTFGIPFPTVKRGAIVRYAITAEDRLGLVSHAGTRAKPVEWVSPNQAPTIVTRGLANNSEVKGVVAVGWTAADLDGDRFTVQATVRPMVLATATTLFEGGDARGEVRWDTTKVPDGRYVVLFTADDGQARRSAYHLVDVNNTGLGVGGVALPQGRVEFLEEIPFRVTLLRPVSTAHVIITRDAGGQDVVVELPLHDDGLNGDKVAGDGEWTAVWTPDVKGAFSVGLRILYEDQGTVERHGASTIEVQSSLANTVSRNLPWIVLAGLLVVLLAIAVVVQLMRYGYL